MGQDRHVAGNQQSKENILEPRRRDVMWRLDQDVATLCDGEQMSLLQQGNKIRCNVIVRPRDNPEIDARFGQLSIQGLYPALNIRPGIVVEAGQDMGCASHHSDTLIDLHARHLQRHGEVAGAVVDRREEVRMKVKHLDEYSKSPLGEDR